jgi:hypothetical protein
LRRYLIRQGKPGDTDWTAGQPVSRPVGHGTGTWDMGPGTIDIGQLRKGNFLKRTFKKFPFLNCPMSIVPCPMSHVPVP